MGRTARRPAFVGITVATVLLLAVSVSAQQQIRCACPTIRAEGRGQSDCSACEAGGQCSIDFNGFGDLEKAAIQRLTEAKISVPSFRFVPGPSNTAFDSLGSDRRAFADQVLVYLTVSGMVRTEPPSVTDLLELAAAIRTESVLGALSSVFGPETSRPRRDRPARPFSSPTPPSSTIQVKRLGEFVVVSPGCVDVRLKSGTSFMYKAIWADAHNEPRCGGSR